MLFRWDAPLFFANAEVFGQDVREAVAASPTWVKGLHDDLAAASVSCTSPRSTTRSRTGHGTTS